MEEKVPSKLSIEPGPAMPLSFRICFAVCRWLNNRGYKSLITERVLCKEKGELKTATSKEIMLQTYGLLPAKFIEPDVVGINEEKNEVCVVEVEEKLDTERLFKVIGKCLVWQVAARQVYVAFPCEVEFSGELLKKLRIGVLSVSANGDIEEKISPPEILEIHVWDPIQEQVLFKQVQRVLSIKKVEPKVRLT